ncbi:hypothetical protein HF969_08445 [Facklamia miroungae]|nr:hypothetical protein [Facklamia miroungae]
MLNTQFVNALTTVNQGDFDYLDPPYIPLSISSFVTLYTKEGFISQNQIKSRNTFIDLIVKM